MRYENLIYFLFNLDTAHLFALLFCAVQISFWKTYPFSLLFYVVLGIYRLLFNSLMSCEHYIRNQQSTKLFFPVDPPETHHLPFFAKRLICRFSRNAHLPFFAKRVNTAPGHRNSSFLAAIVHYLLIKILFVSVISAV